MRIFRISFHNLGKVYRLHAESVTQSDLFGFIEISGILFDEHTSMVIDPVEERMKDEFGGTSRLLLPANSIIRIEEVEKRGQNMVFDKTDNDNIMPFPGFGPGNKP